MKCEKCNHEWTPRTEKPLACPRCKQYLPVPQFSDEVKPFDGLPDSGVTAKFDKERGVVYEIAET